MLPHAGDDPEAAERARTMRTARIRLDRLLYGEPAPRLFSAPSSYSLSAPELARHVRQLRRSGWMHWEVVMRFEWPAA
jgi:hypothetical protein